MQDIIAERNQQEKKIMQMSKYCKSAEAKGRKKGSQ
jgi:hypothetical protein